MMYTILVLQIDDMTQKEIMIITLSILEFKNMIVVEINCHCGFA